MTTNLRNLTHTFIRKSNLSVIVWRIVLGSLFLLQCVGRSSGATLVKRATFLAHSNQVSALTASNRGGFDMVTNSIPVIAVGSTTNSSDGWSGLSTFDGGMGRFNIQATAAERRGWAGGWYRFESFPVNTGDQVAAGYARFINLKRTGGTDGYGLIDLRVYGDGALKCNVAYDAEYTVTNLLPNTWYFLAVAWSLNSSTDKEVRAYVASIADIRTGKLPQLLRTTNGPCSSYGFSVDFGHHSTDAYYWLGRFSAVSIYGITNIENDVMYPPELSLPSTGRNTWYLDSVNGSDDFDGRSLQTAWQSSQKLSDMLHFGGIMGSREPWRWVTNGAPVIGLDDLTMCYRIMDGNISAGGDRVLFQTAEGPFVLTNQFTFRFRNNGVEFGSATSGQADLLSLKTVTNWSLYNGLNYPNVWQSADTESKSVVWEDLKWLNAPTGASIVVVASNLNRSPGSFYNDGTNLYLHPFDSSDPNTNGRVYQRQRWLRGEGGRLVQGMPFYAIGGAVYLHDLRAGGVTDWNPLTGQNSGVYVVSLKNTNWAVIGNCDFYHGGNHIIGGVHAVDNFTDFIFNCTLRQGAPWSGASYSTYVEYVSLEDLTNCAAYVFNTQWSEQGLVNGVTNTGAMNMHDGDPNNASQQYRAFYLTNCTGRLALQPGMVQSPGILVEGGTYRGIDSRTTGGQITIRNARITGRVSGEDDGVVANCLITLEHADVADNLNQEGDWTFLNCTFDAQAIQNATLRRKGGVIRQTTKSRSLCVSNCIFITVDGNQTMPYLLNSKATNRFGHNVYQTGTSNWIATIDTTTNTKTLGDLLGLGMESNSVAADPYLTSKYQPRYGSPCIDQGIDPGPLLTADITGTLRPMDGDGDGIAAFDIGALEYNPAHADSNEDGIPDWWSLLYHLNPCDPTIAASDPDQDFATTGEEWLADTNPTDPVSCLRLKATAFSSAGVSFASSARRLYSLMYCTNLAQSVWFNVPGQQDLSGCGSTLELHDTNCVPSRFYRVEVKLP